MIQSVRGFKDIYGNEAKIWQKVETLLKEIFVKWGFNEVRLPILEKTELFERGIGDDTDIVEKEMYTFCDKSGEKVTLRPEGTASVIRFFNEHKLFGIDRFFKFYYMGPMFRYERPQKGRLRQFHQTGIEILGDKSPTSEVEAITLIPNILDTVNIKDYELRLNSLGCDDCRKFYREKLVSYYKSKLDNLCEDCKRRLNINPLRLVDCKVDGCKELAKSAPLVLDFLCTECAEHFKILKKMLTYLNIRFIEDPLIVRGLDYYNKTVFEVHTTGLGAQSAIMAGGRYDTLSSKLSGYDIPAVGWAMGMERMISLLDSNLFVDEGVDVFVIFIGKNAEEEGLSIVHALRSVGLKTEFDIFNGSIKSQFRRADKLSAKWTIVIGEDELKTGLYQLKNMKSGEQKAVSRDEIVKIVKTI